jgi:hypothetical protein
MIVLPFLELSKNKRVIVNTEFALMSSMCACGGMMAAAIKCARFSVRELRDSFKTWLSQLNNVGFRVRRDEEQSDLIQSRLAVIKKSFTDGETCHVKSSRFPTLY